MGKLRLDSPRLRSLGGGRAKLGQGLEDVCPLLCNTPSLQSPSSRHISGWLKRNPSLVRPLLQCPLSSPHPDPIPARPLQSVFLLSSWVFLASGRNRLAGKRFPPGRVAPGQGLEPGAAPGPVERKEAGPPASPPTRRTCWFAPPPSVSWLLHLERGPCAVAGPHA